MPETTNRWGRGRRVFFAQLHAIREEIASAIPLTEVFATRSEQLGVGYSAFCKLVAKYANDVKPKPVSANQTTMSLGPMHGHKKLNEHTGIADPVQLRKLVHGG